MVKSMPQDIIKLAFFYGFSLVACVRFFNLVDDCDRAIQQRDRSQSPALGSICAAHSRSLLVFEIGQVGRTNNIFEWQRRSPF
ncbi:hypothetical protein HC928_23950 [bacterium]|nr:hypothetical protein [bacterium]